MNDLPILESIDPELMGRLASRRGALSKLVKLGGVAITAPVLLAALAQDAYGKSLPGEVLEVLRFALLLERMETDFYDRGLAAPGLIPPQHRTVFERIRDNEAAHCNLLGTASASPVNTAKFDHTGGGRLPDVFTSYRTFLARAQDSEETGVRAYKGQAPRLMQATLILSVALRIHSVEARHVAKIRSIRGRKGWITGSSRDSLPAFFQPTYDGEGNTSQLGVSLAGIGGTPASAASEAFDEPLTKAQVLAIVDPFIVGDPRSHI